MRLVSLLEHKMASYRSLDTDAQACSSGLIMIQNGDIKARITMARQVQIWKLSVSSIRVLKNSSAYPEMDFSDYGKWISNQFNIEKKINNSKDLLTI